MKNYPKPGRRSFWRTSAASYQAHEGDSAGCVYCNSRQLQKHPYLPVLPQLFNEKHQELPQILLIDPDVNIAVRLSDALEPAVQVHHSRSVNEARELLMSRHFNVVIIDPDFPGCDLADLRALLADAKSEAAVLILSNHALNSDGDFAPLLMHKAATSSAHLLLMVQSLLRG